MPGVRSGARNSWDDTASAMGLINWGGQDEAVEEVGVDLAVRVRVRCDAEQWWRWW
jgi:hypothetical protein